MKRFRLAAVLCAVAAVLLLVSGADLAWARERPLTLGSAPDPGGRTWPPVRGTLRVGWGDQWRGWGGVSGLRFFLASEAAGTIEIAIDHELVAAAGGARVLEGRRVEVGFADVERSEANNRSQSTRVVSSLRFVDATPTAKVAKAVTGSQPWVSLLCKFADVADEPRDLAYFQGMYSLTFPGLDHYWRELSYDVVNVSGSTAVAWVTMPYPVDHYATPDGGDTTALLNDCTAAADPYVHFPSFVGINMMFNDEFGPYAWGGSQYLNRDGVSKIYRVTWEPPWGYANEGVIAHEMGHGFGLPHSNNADGDGSPYDNPWDVMSDTWYYVVSHPTYGKLGKGTIAYHLDLLGWIGPGQKTTVDAAGTFELTLDHLALAETENLRLIRIEKPGTSTFYTVEVRDRVGYDGQLPGFAVVIHDVDPLRLEEAWLVDDENTENGADEGAMWRVGECFEDLAHDISVCVQSVTAEGFVVEVAFGDVDTVFADGFEGSDTNAWSSTVP